MTDNDFFAWLSIGELPAYLKPSKYRRSGGNIKCGHRLLSLYLFAAKGGISELKDVVIAQSILHNQNLFRRMDLSVVGQIFKATTDGDHLRSYVVAWWVKEWDNYHASESWDEENTDSIGRA